MLSCIELWVGVGVCSRCISMHLDIVSLVEKIVVVLQKGVINVFLEAFDVPSIAILVHTRTNSQEFICLWITLFFSKSDSTGVVEFLSDEEIVIVGGIDVHLGTD